MTGPALQAVELSKSYGDAAAVGPLDLTIDAGERVVLLGHNGSGKTTLLRMAAGLLEASTGSIAVFGSPVGSIEARAATSYLGDQPIFYDDLSLREHLEYIARLHGLEDWQQRGDDLCEALGVAARADELPTTFSRGLRQKAAIALAFVRPFELLLIDEPFVGLDLAGRIALLELLDREHRRGAAIVVATHELGTVSAAQRLVALRDGAVAFDGPQGTADVDTLVMK